MKGFKDKFFRISEFFSVLKIKVTGDRVSVFKIKGIRDGFRVHIIVKWDLRLI